MLGQDCGGAYINKLYKNAVLKHKRIHKKS